MAKKLYAVTNVNHDGVFYEAGSELDRKMFSQQQLNDLYDAGAVEVRDSRSLDVSDDEEPAGTPETPVDPQRAGRPVESTEEQDKAREAKAKEAAERAKVRDAQAKDATPGKAATRQNADALTNQQKQNPAN